MPQGYDGLPNYYLQSSNPITPNLGLSLKGMDAIVAEDFVLIDTAFGSVGGSIKINGAVVANPNFINSGTATLSVVGSNISITAAAGSSVDVNGVPIAAPNFMNSATVTFSVVGGNVTATAAASATPGAPLGSVQGNNGGVFGGMPGSTIDFTNGILSIAPPGTGVALTVTGDASGSNAVHVGSVPMAFSGGVSVLVGKPADASGYDAELGAYADFTGNTNSGAYTLLDQNLTISVSSPSSNYWLGTHINVTAGGTDTINSVAGMDITITGNDTALISSLMGITSFVQDVGSGGVTNIIGILSTVSAHYSAGRLYGGLFLIANDSTSTVTDAASIHIYTPSWVGGSTITHSYGIYIENQKTPLVAGNLDPWAIYVVGGKSYFGDGVSLQSTLTDGSASVGTPGQVLSSTGTKVAWTSAPAAISVPWSSITNAAANLTLANADYTTTFNQTSAVPWTWANTTAALTPGVYVNSVSTASAGAVTTLTTPAFVATAGNLIVVAVAFGAGQTAAPTDTAGNTYVLRFSGTYWHIYSAPNCLGNATNTVNAHWSVASGYVAIQVQQFAGYGAFDVSAMGSVAGAGTLTTSAFTTTQAAEVVCAFVANSGNPVTPTGFTVSNSGVVYNNLGYYKQITSIQTGATIVVVEVNSAWLDVVTFKANAGVGITGQSSPIFSLSGTSWNGAASITDAWTIQDSISAILTNPASTLTFTHTGSSGQYGVLVPSLYVGVADTGISRLGAASFAFGNGTQGDFTANLKLNALTAVSTIAQSTGQVHSWNNDSGISRLGAGSLAIGNGTAGDFSGSLKLNGVNVQGLTASELVATDASKNLVSVTALPSGTTGTTSAPGTSSTVLATTAFVAAAISAGGLGSRTTAALTYNLVALASDATQAFAMTGKSWMIIGFNVTGAGSNQCRVRLYSTALARTNDAPRPYTVPLQLGTQHGCIGDFYFDQVNSVTPWICSPNILGSNQDGSPVASLYANVQNIDTLTQSAMTVTLTFVPLEI